MIVKSSDDLEARLLSQVYLMQMPHWHQFQWRRALPALMILASFSVNPSLKLLRNTVENTVDDIGIPHCKSQFETGRKFQPQCFQRLLISVANSRSDGSTLSIFSTDRPPSNIITIISIQDQVIEVTKQKWGWYIHRSSIPIRWNLTTAVWSNWLQARTHSCQRNKINNWMSMFFICFRILCLQELQQSFQISVNTLCQCVEIVRGKVQF